MNEKARKHDLLTNCWLLSKCTLPNKKYLAYTYLRRELGLKNLNYIHNNHVTFKNVYSAHTIIKRFWSDTILNLNTRLTRILKSKSKTKLLMAE